MKLLAPVSCLVQHCTLWPSDLVVKMAPASQSRVPVFKCSLPEWISNSHMSPLHNSWLLIGLTSATTGIGESKSETSFSLPCLPLSLSLFNIVSNYARNKEKRKRKGSHSSSLSLHFCAPHFSL